MMKYLRGHETFKPFLEEWWGAMSCAMIYLSAGMILRHIRRQIKQGIVIEEGKVWAALRHRLPVAGSLKVWMIMIPLLRKHGNQGSAWDMLQQDRALQGVRRSAGPVLHIPFHTGQSEWKTGSGIQVKWTCSPIRRVEIKAGWNKACKIQNSIIRYDRAVTYSYFR